MIIYGGIFEVTKELNDMHIFDFKNEQWGVLFEELNSPQKNANMNTGQTPNSVGIKKTMNKIADKHESSPRKEMKGNKRVSTAKGGQKKSKI
jgi:hypothetical protein